jgi:hypothetical protein
LSRKKPFTGPFPEPGSPVPLREGTISSSSSRQEDKDVATTARKKNRIIPAFRTGVLVAFRAKYSFADEASARRKEQA